MDYRKLAASLAANAATLAGMTDEQVAAWYAEQVSEPGAVPINQVLRWSAGTDALNRLRTESTTGPKAKRQIADAALELVNHPHISTLDVTDSEIAAMLAGLVALGVFAQAEIDALTARGVRSISRAESFGLPAVAVGHVAKARALIAEG